MADILINVEKVKKHFPVTKGLIFSKPTGWVKAIDGIDFSISECETFGLVGESGCGKTTLARLILLLETVSASAISFLGRNIALFKEEELKKYRASVQAVFQDPFSSLNPRMRVKRIIAEPMKVNSHWSRKTIEDRVAELLDFVGIRRDAGHNYPHEFSGGQRQRIAIARALGMNPRFIILDEPVSALDVSIRAQIINLLKRLQDEFKLTYLLIAHDLAVVHHMSTKIGIMYLGKLMEIALSDELFSHPFHPYTQALLSAALPAHPDAIPGEQRLKGEIPSPLNPPAGCRFHPRCPESFPACSLEEPLLKEISKDHYLACHLNR